MVPGAGATRPSTSPARVGYMPSRSPTARADGSLITAAAASPAAPTDDGSLAFFAGHDSCVHAVDCATGLRVWTSSPMDGVRSAGHHATAGGHGHGHDGGSGSSSGSGKNPRVLLLVGGSSGHVYCLDAATGVQRWRSQHPGASVPWVNMPPALSPDGSLVYFGSCDTRVYALRRAQAARVGARAVRRAGDIVTVLSDGRRVYVCVEMEGVVALEVESAVARSRAGSHTASPAGQQGTGTGTGTGISQGRELWSCLSKASGRARAMGSTIRCAPC